MCNSLSILRKKFPKTGRKLEAWPLRGIFGPGIKDGLKYQRKIVIITHAVANATAGI